MFFLNSKYLSWILITIQVLILSFVNLTVDEVSIVAVSVKYLVLIISIVSGIVSVFFYKFVMYLCLTMSGIFELKREYFFNNIIYSSLILNTSQLFLLKYMNIDTTNFFIRMFSPVNILTLIVLFFYLKNIESITTKQIYVFIVLLVILNFTAQIISNYIGVMN